MKGEHFTGTPIAPKIPTRVKSIGTKTFLPILVDCALQSDTVGVMECQCGTVHTCKLTNKLCSIKAPIDNLVHAIIDEKYIRLIDDVFTHCAVCPEKRQPVIARKGNIDCVQTGTCLTTPPDRSVECDVVIPFCVVDSHFLHESVASILQQTRAKTIIHLVSDGAPWPDNIPTADNIRRYESPAQGLGPYRLTNSLLPYFETEYLAIQDCDDISFQDRLWKQVITLEKSGYDMISGGMTQFVDKASQSCTTTVALCQGWPTLYSGMCYPVNPLGAMVNSVKTMRVSLFKKLNGFCDWLMSADHEWDARVAAAGYKLYHATDNFGKRRLHKKSLSNGLFPIGHEERHRLSELIAEQRQRIEQGTDAAIYGGIPHAPQIKKL